LTETGQTSSSSAFPMSTNESPAPGVMNRLLRSLSIGKAETPSLPPLPVVVPSHDDTPNDPVINTSPTKPDANEAPGALGRLKSLAKFKKEKKPAEAEVDLAVVTEEAVASAPPAPLTLAQKIRDLIDALPPVTGKEPLPKPKPVKTGPNGKPIPPTIAAPIHDAQLIAQLNSPSIMNGSKEKGTASVWSVLESLGAPTHENDEGNSGPNDDSDDDGTDHSSFMMYCPLIPTEDSTIEIAQTELRPAVRTQYAEGEVLLVEEEDDGKGNVSEKALLWTFPWPWSKKTPAPPKMIPVWIPSTTKLSIHTTWWGYHL
jgi:hypothetical protein